MIETRKNSSEVVDALEGRAFLPTLARASSSVRTRIFLVILLATLPLAASALFLAWGDYRAQLGLSARRVDAVLSDYLATERAELRVASASLDALAASLPAGGSACATMIGLASSLAAGRYDGLGVVRSGTVSCGMVDEALRAQSGPSAAGFGMVIVVADGSLAIPKWRPLAIDPGSLLVAGVRLRGTGHRYANVGIWFVDRAGRPVTLSAAGEVAPGVEDLAQLETANSSVTKIAGGKRDVFVSGALPGGNLVIVGGRATDEEARAARLLVQRMAAIAFLLSAGLALVTLGAHVTVAAPIQALTQRVTRWRMAGRFDDANLRFVPSELAELIDAFGLATRSLAARESELDRARLEQELAFKEIHHRVKNNLQIIASLLNLQANRIRQPEAKAEFQSARDRVRALATLHRHLYADGGLYSITMRSFLLELCGQLFQAIGEREGHRIRLDVEAPELQMSSDQAVPVALIVTEAVGNAIKYAFPGGRSGSVSVRLRLLDAERISLTIEDDGVGIPAGRAETETGVRDGLGIQLIRGFAKQLGANLEVTEGEGTRYYLELRLRQSEAVRTPAANPVA